MYNPSNWYWSVTGNTESVYSSARASFVSSSDAEYQSWRAAGCVPTKIASEEELIEVLAAQYPVGHPKSYAMDQLAKLDAFIPRGLEDMWQCMSFDTASLPEVQQERLQQKKDLREQLAG